MELSLAELLKNALGGANGGLLAMLNAACFVGARWSLLSRRVAIALSMLVGGCLTALGAFSEALATEGVSTAAMTNSAIAGFFFGMGASSIVGWAVSLMLDKSGVWPLSVTKRYSEDLRDPLSPSLPEGAQPVPAPKEKSGEP